MKNNQKELILLKDLGTMFATETSKRKYRFGLFKCYCGSEFKTQINSIKSGHTKSCGCKERTGNMKHGLSNHRL